MLLEGTKRNVPSITHVHRGRNEVNDVKEPYSCQVKTMLTITSNYNYSSTSFEHEMSL